MFRRLIQQGQSQIVTASQAITENHFDHELGSPIMSLSPNKIGLLIEQDGFRFFSYIENKQVKVNCSFNHLPYAATLSLKTENIENEEGIRDAFVSCGVAVLKINEGHLSAEKASGTIH